MVPRIDACSFSMLRTMNCAPPAPSPTSPSPTSSHATVRRFPPFRLLLLLLLFGGCSLLAESFPLHRTSPAMTPYMKTNVVEKGEDAAWSSSLLPLPPRPRHVSTAQSPVLHRSGSCCWRASASSALRSSSAAEAAAEQDIAAGLSSLAPTSSSSEKEAGEGGFRLAFTRDELLLLLDVYHGKGDADKAGKSRGIISDPPPDAQLVLLLDRVRDALPSLSPSLLVKLRRWSDATVDARAATVTTIEDSESVHDRYESDSAAAVEAVRAVARAVETLLEQRLEDAASLLKELLAAGEIRKLDSLIGKAGRQGRLDPAFFQVLQMNLRDAAPPAVSFTSSSSSDDDDDAATRTSATNPSSKHYQILTHIYTRCQEEVEKSMEPGMAVLNKLLRTPDPSIRSNILRHYLTPTKTTITSPDGTTIELVPTTATTGSTASTAASSSSLVSIDDYIQAVATFVSQVRKIQHGQEEQQQQQQPSVATTTSMIESCRLLCKQVLGVLVEAYGMYSPQVQKLKDGLQPVFRPGDGGDDAVPAPAQEQQRSQ